MPGQRPPFRLRCVDSQVFMKALLPLTDPQLGSSSVADINYLAQAIKNAAARSFLLGMVLRAKVTALARPLEQVQLPVVETFQGADCVSWNWKKLCSLDVSDCFVINQVICSENLI